MEDVFPELNDYRIESYACRLQDGTSADVHVDPGLNRYTLEIETLNGRSPDFVRDIRTSTDPRQEARYARIKTGEILEENGVWVRNSLEDQPPYLKSPELV